MFSLEEHINNMEPNGTLHRGIPASGQDPKYYVYKCHMIPFSYFSPLIDPLSCLIIEFQLEYIEVVSLLRSYGAMPMTTFYFVKAAMMSLYNLEGF